MVTLAVDDINQTKYNNSYRLSDFVGKDDEYIRNSRPTHISINHNELLNNVDLLRHILKVGNKYELVLKDYRTALALEELLKNDIRFTLLDDYQNRDRSYIDPTIFERHKLTIPLSYVMWGIHIPDKVDVYAMRFMSDKMESINGDTTITKDTIDKIFEIVDSLNITTCNLEKIILVSNYLQSRVQYVAGRINIASDGTYIIDAPDELITRKKVDTLTTVINDNYGVCMGIANATTLLLNNPIFNINVRTMMSNDHVWNLVRYHNRLYYIDNTWNITKNKDLVKDTLKANSFTEEYFMCGTDKVKNSEHHIPNTYLSGIVEEHDYNRARIDEKVKLLSKSVRFKNYTNKPVFESSYEAN